MRSLLSLLFLLYLTVDAQALPGDPVSSSVEAGIQQATENAVARQVEQDIESAVEESVEESVSAEMDDRVSAAVEGTVMESATSAAEESVARDVESAAAGEVESAVAAEVETAVQAAVESGADSVVEANVEQDVERGVADAMARTVSQAVDRNVGAVVEEAVGGAVAEDVAAEVSRVAEGNAVHRVRETAKSGPLSAGAPAGSAVQGIRQEEPAGAVAGVRSAAGDLLFHEVEVEDGWHAVAREWLLVVEVAEVERLAQAGITLLERETLEGLGLQLVRIRTDGDVDAYPELKALLPAATAVDRNHIYEYLPQSSRNDGEGGYTHAARFCDREVKVGLVDSAVDQDHPALVGARITQRSFSPAGTVVERDHGTAVAGILAGRDADVQGVLGDAELSAAAVMYSRRERGQGATAMSLVRALDWLVTRQVAVINLSLAGPPNRILERALARVADRGVPVVAAVGNAGPAAPPLYPAAYPGVIGVTAVDGGGAIYRWANRGGQVDFAAPGVNILTLDGSGGVRRDSGTSLAAPVVAALAGCLRAETATEPLLARLEAAAMDLGAPGRDEVFGVGAVGLRGVSAVLR